MKPLPWSFSSLSGFRTCPKQFYHLRIAKDVDDPPNPQGLWGDYVHKEFQKYLEAKKAGHTYELASDIPSKWGPYLDAIAEGPGEMFVECKYAVTATLAPCDFFAKDVWARGIIDVLHIDGDEARVIDHKTGKYKIGTDQLKLCALLVFMHHPQVQRVKTGYFWLAETKLTKEMYTREEMSDMWKSFVPDLYDYTKAFKEETFNPKPSGLCREWCAVEACQHNGVHHGYGVHRRKRR